MTGVLGILLSLGLLMYLAYRGINVLVLAPALALLATILNGDPRLLGTYTQIFMTGLGGFLVKYFPLFLLGAIFGRLMSDSGAAAVIARRIAVALGPRRAIVAIVASCAILTYGGVSVFVVVFAVYPIATVLFRDAGIPKRLMPGAIVLGAATFTMTAFPGTPAVQNAIPMPFFGTDPFAAPGVGVVAGLVMAGFGGWWLARRARTAAGRGEGYGDHPGETEEVVIGEDRIGLLPALLPLGVVIGLNWVMTRFVIPAMDTGYLAEGRFGGVTLNEVRGIWSLVVALSAAIVLLIVLRLRHWRDLTDSVNSGTMSSLLPIFNTASEVGYGSVIASLAGFAAIQSVVMGLWPANPLVSEAISVNVLAGITGSASGGMSIALKAFGATYLELGTAAGIDPALLHRIAAIASGGLDSLPHNGAVITMLGICRLTHRQSYADIFMVSVAGPLVALVVALVLGTAFGSF